MRLQNLFFPEGISYNSLNRVVRTKRINSGMALIPELAKVLAKTKKGGPISSDQFSHFVTSRGFEPPTNGTGIRHSIQLNYEARCGCLRNRRSKITVFLILSAVFSNIFETQAFN